MDPSSPAATPSPTQQAPPMPTEKEVAEYLLLLGDNRPGRQGKSVHPEDFDMEEKQNPVADESTVEVCRILISFYFFLSGGARISRPIHYFVH